ncbi:MAG: type II toxin-antitoxin system VapC family toxin [Gemmatimonadota bacterium]
MRVLLDTHIWIWSLLEPDRLSGRVRKLLTDPDTEMRLSPISTWELLLLIEKGRVEVEGEGHEWVSEALRRAPLVEAPLTHEVALESRRIELPHADPADRFLCATARVYDLSLVTADARLLGYDGGFATITNE